MISSLSPLLQDITTRLSAVKSAGELTALYADLAQAALSPAERELLKRCAVPRNFDARLMDAVIRPGVAGGDAESVPFAHFVENSAIERLPGEEGVYRVRDSLRDTLLAREWGASAMIPQSDNMPLPPDVGPPSSPQTDATDPPASPPDSDTGLTLAAFSRGLADYYAQLGEAGELDRLYHLVVADPKQAAALFRRLYEEADKAFRLGRCSDLIRVLEQRRSLLDSELMLLCKDRVAYRQARGYWTEEHDRTTRYFERDAQKKVFLDVLARCRAGDPGSPWVLWMHAPGGLGKTSFIRWLIARYCIPEPQRIPCARLDFDLEQHFEITRHPWLLLYRIVEQLNLQLPNAPFVELLESLREQYKDLKQQEKTGTAAASLAWQEVLSRFAETLGDAPLPGPLVIILDTLEQVLLRPPAHLLTVLEPLIALKEKYPRLLLILSGRNSLAEKALDVQERLGLWMRDLTVTPFTPDEARTYLTQTWGLPAGDTLEAVIEAASGPALDSAPEGAADGKGTYGEGNDAGANPFKLTLFVEILRANPHYTVADVRAYGKNVDIAYLIERVVERIDDPQVRWVLRYGVVPRRLTFDFVTAIMAPRLAEAMTGQSQEDDPTRDADVPPEKRNKFPNNLLRSPDAIDLSDLWDKLNRYAGQYSWVSPDATDPKALAFHPDVVYPMRRLLQAHAVFFSLHQEAAAYYERQAEADSAGWEHAMREAVYHRFQGEGAAAAAFWGAHVTRALQQGRMERVRAMAREVVGPEYVDGAGQPRARRDGTLLVSPQILMEANYRLAQSWLDETAFAASPDDERNWSEAHSAFERAEMLAAQLPASFLSPLERACLRATLRLHAVDARAALTTLEEAIGVPPSLSWAHNHDSALSPQALSPPQAEAQDALLDFLGNADLFLGPLYAAAVAQLGDREFAIRIYERVYAASVSWIVLRRALREQLIRLYTLTEQYAPARALCEAALADAAAGGGPQEAAPDAVGERQESVNGKRETARLRRRLVELNLRLGNWKVARETADAMLPAAQVESECDPETIVENARALLLAANVHLDYGEPGQVVEWMRSLQALLTQWVSNLPTARYHELMADALLACGHALTLQQAYGGALSALEQAYRHYQALGQAYGIKLCLLRLLRLHLRETGDVGRFAAQWQEAERLLRAGTLFSAVNPDEVETELSLALLETEWLQHSRKEQEALARVDELLDAPRVQQSPLLTARAALQGVVLAASLPRGGMPMGDAPKPMGPMPTRDAPAGSAPQASAPSGPPDSSGRADGGRKARPAEQADQSVNRYMTTLLTALERLENSIARLAVLEDLASCPALSSLPGEGRQRLLALIEIDFDTQPLPLVFTALEAYWVCGEQERVRTLLDRQAARFAALPDKALLFPAVRAWITHHAGNAFLNWASPDALHAQLADLPVLYGKSLLLLVTRLSNTPDNAEIAEPIHALIKEAEAALLREATPNRGQADAALLRFGFETLFGQKDEAEGALLRARRVAQTLSNPDLQALIEETAQSMRSAGEMRRGNAAGTDAPSTSGPSVTVTAQLVPPDAIEIEARGREAGLWKNIVTGNRIPLVAALYRGEDRSVIPYDLVRAVSADLAWGHEDITRLLSLPERLAELANMGMFRDGVSDVCLQIRGELLSALPWELTARMGTGEASFPTLAGGRYLYRGRVEPYGMTTTVRSGGQRMNKTPGVLILQPSDERRKTQQRGYHAGSDLAAVYERRGLRVTSLTDPGPGTIWDAVQEQRPAIVHLVATLKEAAFTGIYLDFARNTEDVWRGSTPSDTLSESASGGPGTFTASSLVSLLRPLCEYGGALVIVDALPPPGKTERVRQLLLRNAFASDLFHALRDVSVLGIGLRDEYQTSIQSDQLAKLLGEGRSVGDIANALRAAAPNAQDYDWEESVGARGVVLYADDPDGVPTREADSPAME